MKIWIHLNGTQQGPYDLNQLGNLPVDPSTPVWYDGLQGWMPAGQAPATASLFAAGTATPPPHSPQPPYGNPPGGAPWTVTQPRPATYIGWSILLTIVCCSPVALLAAVTGAISSSRYNSGDYNGARSMSNLTEWLIIIAIVFAFITAPLGITWFL